MAVYLTSEITVGNFTWAGVCNVRITKSLHSLKETAVITLPSTVTVTKENKPAEVRVSAAADLFKVGDKVLVKLGYDGDNREEFRGFVNRPDLKEPFVLECEGYSYQLRRADKIAKQYASVTIKSLLEFVLKGTDITIHPDTPATTLTGVVINHLDAYDTLEMLCKTKVLVAYFIGGNALYVGPKDLANQDKQTKYWLGWNTVRDGDLKYRNKEDCKVQIAITYKDEKGKSHHFTDGDSGGQNITINAGRCSKEAALVMAQQKASMFVYEGYEGKIKTFLQPYTEVGWKASIQDVEYSARSGNYIIEAQVVDFGHSGAWRTLEIGKRISKQK